MNCTLRQMTDQERLYAYTQSSQIDSMTGSIGHLRADMDRDGEGFFSSWTDFRSDLKTDELREEIDELINDLIDDGGVLQNWTALSKFCYANPEAADSDFRSFFFRADTAEHSYMFRLNPNKGEYACYCYCYRRSWLDRQLSESQRGIKFLDQNYNELFRLRDGAKIRVTFPDGEVQERVCRYIDPTHFEYGTGALSVFHTSQFAEWMAGTDAVFEPVNEADIVQIPQRKYDRGR